MRTNVFLLSPSVVFRARVSDMGSTSYPLTAVNYDTLSSGSAAAVKPGMTVRFGSAAGLDDKGRQRITRAVTVGSSTSGAIYIGLAPQGNHDGELDLEDGDYIEVLDDYRVWAKIPYIYQSGLDTIFLKDGYASPIGNVEEAPPIANGGPGFAATIDPSSHKITHTFDGSASFQFNVSVGTPVGTVASYLWNVADGTITVGSTTTATLTATFPAGFRWVTLTVTATNGKTHTCHIPVFARDPAADLCIPHQITAHHIASTGQEVSFRPLIPLPRATYPDGTLCMIWVDRFDDPLDPDESRMAFVGWHQSDQNDISGGRTGTLRDSVLTCVDVAGRLARLPGMGQHVISNIVPVNVRTTVALGGTSVDVHPLSGPISSGAVLNFGGFGGTQTATLTATAHTGAISLSVSALPHTLTAVVFDDSGAIVSGDHTTYAFTPFRWEQTAYPQMLYYLWYLLYWHSTALEVADLLLGTSILQFFPFWVLSSDESDLFRQVNDLANIITPDHYLTCNQAGQLLLVVDPNLMALVDRLPSSRYVADDEITGVSFADTRPPKVSRLTSYAVLADTSSAVAIACQAPGVPSAVGQGANTLEQSRRFAEGQSELNLCEGMRYAKLNARHGPVTFRAPWPLLENSLEPANMLYTGLYFTSPPRAYERTVVAGETRGLVTEINIAYEYSDKGVSATATLQWQEETYGPEAVTIDLT